MFRQFRTIGWVAGLTLFTNLLGFIREVLVARAIGTTAEADAFITAFTVVAACFLVFSAGTVQAAFMPRYQSLTAGSPAAARFLFWRAFGILAILLVGISLSLGLGAKTWVSLVAPGFDSARVALSVELLPILAPMVLFFGLGSLLQAELHSRQRFLAPATVPLLINVLVIVFLVWLVPVLGVKGLAWGFVAGSFLWVGYLMPLVWPKVRGTRIPASAEFRATIGNLWPLLILLIADQVSTLAQRTFASGLETGAIAALNYAYKIEGLPIGILATAAATVFFPMLVADRSGGNVDLFADKAHLLYQSVVALLLPISVYLCVDGKLFIRILFERGAFDSASTDRTNVALFYYSAGMVAQGLIVAANKVYFSLEKTKTPVAIGVVAAVLHVGFCWVAVKAQGFQGIASGTSLYAWSYALALLYFTRRLYPFSWCKFFVNMRVPGMALLASMGAYMVMRTILDTSDLLFRLSAVAVGVCTYYLALAWFWRTRFRILVAQ